MLSQDIVLTELESILEKQLSEVVAQYQNMPEEQLFIVRDQGNWSIAQCFDHLNTYAAFYHPLLKRAIEKTAEQDAPILFKHSWLGTYFIDMMDASKSRKRYKAMKRHQPQKVVEAHKALCVYIQHQENLLQMLKQSEHKPLMKMKIATSISPLLKINGGDVMRFLLIHSDRHLRQSSKNLKA